MLCNIKNSEINNWQRYIKYVVSNKNSYSELKLIIEEIQDNYKKKSILKELMNIDGFNPFFPEYSLIKNETTRNYLLKKRNYINQYKDYCRLINFHCCDGIIFHTSHNDIDDNFDIKIIFNSHMRKIIFKDNKKHHFNIEKIYETLNALDDNIWSMYNSKSYIYVNKGSKSKLDLKKIVNIIKENEKESA